jgi:RNase P subunit RPR2
MPTPNTQRQAAHSPRKSTHHLNDWRCTRCDKLLGICRDGRMHLRFARGHEYFVSFPVVATCRGCGTLNQVTDSAQR